jgi:16S rRNA (guanine(1405)-N(7))-methyltransferase
MPGPVTVDAVVAELRRSRRYGALAEPTLRRAAEAAVGVEGERLAAASKRAKRALHEIHGAYLPSRPPYRRLESELREAIAAGDRELVEARLRNSMRYHASTAERLPILDDFYERILALAGTPASVLDVGCGLNPLARPWMPLPETTEYRALDVDAQLVAFVDACLTLLAVPHTATVLDVLAAPPPAAELVLLLKTIPCLEQQAPGAGYELVERLDARVVVCSFPRASLGGRAKGMTRTYAERFEAAAARSSRRRERLDLPGELVYVVWR